MAEISRRILVEKDLRPSYYDDFRCLAQDCKISCCKGWNITFGKKDYLSLKRQEGSSDLNSRMNGALQRVRKGPMAEISFGKFALKDGVCPLLRQDGLCQLQREKGHEVLPLVCRSYPRSERRLASGFLERSLSPSCEGVLALLWDLPKGVEFRSDALGKGERRNIEPVGDGPMPLWFAPVREWCVDVLQDRRFSLPHRIWLMGMGLRELADGETDIQRWMQRAAVLPCELGAASVIPSGDREQAMFLSSCVHTLLSIQIGDPTLLSIRSQLLEGMGLAINLDARNTVIPLGPYRKAAQLWKERFAEREYFMENLMVAVFFHLSMPHMTSKEDLWKSYVNFCNLYAFYRFLSVMSCREGVEDSTGELFRLIVFGSRALIHNSVAQAACRDEFFQNDSATLAHMAILLSG